MISELNEKDIASSEKIDQVAKALCAVQGEIPLVVKSSEVNAGRIRYKYAQLGDIIQAIQPVLTRHKLSYAQPILNGAIATILIHESGQWLGYKTPAKPEQSGAKGIGSVVTYMRRYALAALFGIPQADDDGQAADGHPGLQDRASEWLQRLASCNNLRSIQTVADAIKGERQTMPDGLVDTLYAGYNKHKKRLLEQGRSATAKALTGNAEDLDLADDFLSYHGRPDFEKLRKLGIRTTEEKLVDLYTGLGADE